MFSKLKPLKHRELENIIDTVIEESYHITNQEDALLYLNTIATTRGSTSEKSEAYIHSVLQKELLPHVGIDYKSYNDKIIYISYMLQKLLQTYYGLREFDDHDSCKNKRQDEGGILVGNIFKQAWSKLNKELQMMVKRKMDGSNLKDITLSQLVNNTGLSKDVAYCFPAGTLISTKSGLSIPIERLSLEGGESVLGWNGDKSLVYSTQTGLIKQKVKDTIVLTFQNGKKLTCTPDHKILIQVNDKFEWVEAEKIPIHSRVAMGVDMPEDIIDNDIEWKFTTSYKLKKTRPVYQKDMDGNIINTFESAVIAAKILNLDTSSIYKTCKGKRKHTGHFKWDYADSIDEQVVNISWDINVPEERRKILAFSRMLGFLMADGDINSDLTAGKVCLGNKIDVNTFIEDYKLFTNKEARVTDESSEQYGKTYKIHLPARIVKLIGSLKGIAFGKRSTQKPSLPEFILDPNCPVSVVREFLGGLYGGDGYCPRLVNLKRKRRNIQGIGFSWTTCDEFSNDMKTLFDDLCKLLNKVGVPNAHSNGPYHDSDQLENRVYYTLMTPANTLFLKNVGFRYCIHKQYKLSVASNYWNFLEEIKRQHNFIVNRVDELKKQNSKISLLKYIKIVHKELVDKEYILNQYYSLPSLSQVKTRRLTNSSHVLFKIDGGHDVMEAKEFLEEIGALKWFQQEYVCERDAEELPMLTLKLMDIRKGQLNNKSMISA